MLGKVVASGLPTLLRTCDGKTEFNRDRLNAQIEGSRKMEAVALHRPLLYGNNIAYRDVTRVGMSEL